MVTLELSKVKLFLGLLTIPTVTVHQARPEVL